MYMKLEEMNFYRWTQKLKDKIFEDVIFIVDINSTSAPGILQCWAFQLESLQYSDMIPGRMYNYKYELKDKDKYYIKKLTVDDIHKSFFFESVFHGRVNLK